MPENNGFIYGALLLACSAGAAAQSVPTSAVLPAEDIVPALSADVPPDNAGGTAPFFPGDGVTQGQLETLQGNNILLEVQVQGARLKKQLAEAAESGGMASVPAVSPLPPGGAASGTVPAQAVAKRPGRITVLEIGGRGQALQATLAFPDGRVAVVAQGNALPGTGLTVKAISLSAVTLSDGSQLTF